MINVDASEIRLRAREEMTVDFMGWREMEKR